jgi:hypothetical protein
VTDKTFDTEGILQCSSSFAGAHAFPGDTGLGSECIMAKEM